MNINLAIPGRPQRKKLVPLSPSRKNITFDKLRPTAIPSTNQKGAVLELVNYYLELGAGPAKALRSALADLPEAAI